MVNLAIFTAINALFQSPRHKLQFQMEASTSGIGNDDISSHVFSNWKAEERQRRTGIIIPVKFGINILRCVSRSGVERAAGPAMNMFHVHVLNRPYLEHQA